VAVKNAIASTDLAGVYYLRQDRDAASGAPRVASSPEAFWTLRWQQEACLVNALQLGRIGVIACAAMTTQASNASLLETIAFTHRPVPGAPNATFNRPGRPTMNNLGHVAFLDSFGIWTDARGGELVAAPGDLAPGTPPGTKFFYVGDPIINDLGQMAIPAFIQNAGPSGIWLAHEGQINPVAVPGDTAIGLPNYLSLRSAYNVRLNNQGDVAFTAEAGSFPYHNGIWTWQNGARKEIFPGWQLGLPIPANTFVESLTDYALSDSGDVAVVGELKQIGGPGGDAAVFTYDNQALRLVAHENANFPNATYFQGIDELAYNNSGHVAFSLYAFFFGATFPGGISVQSYGTVWLDTGGQLTPVATDNQIVNFAGNSYTFEGTFTNVVMNGSDEIAFLARFTDDATGDLRSGVWKSSNGELQLIADFAKALPGFNETDEHSLLTSADISINSRGQVAFLTPKGLWATDRNGVLRMIAMRGKQISVDEGPEADLQTVLEIGAWLGSGGEDGRYDSFNDQGALAFQALTGDGYGIFISHAAEVPEPTSFVLALLPLIAVMAPKRQRRTMAL
jgi:hypothetical protein